MSTLRDSTISNNPKTPKRVVADAAEEVDGDSIAAVEEDVAGVTVVVIVAAIGVDAAAGVDEGIIIPITKL